MAEKTTITTDITMKPAVPYIEQTGLKQILRLFERAMRQDWLYHTSPKGAPGAAGLDLGDAAAVAWGEVTIAIENFRKSDEISDPSIKETIDILERITPVDIPETDDLKVMFQRLRVIADTAPKKPQDVSKLILDAAATVHVFDVHLEMLRIRSAS